MTEPPKRDLNRLEGVVESLLERHESVPPEQKKTFFVKPEAVQEVLAPLHRDREEPRSAEDRRNRIGEYQLLGELGRGGMGVVYEAEDKALRRRVAIKVLPAHLTLRQNAVQRFQREAEAVARLRHPGIVRIYAVGSDQDAHYFVMELVRGASLDKVLARLRDLGTGIPREAARFRDALAGAMLPPPGAGEVQPERGGYVALCVQLVAQVADALDHSHSAGVIHRDVKPSNILVRPDGTTVLTDFGVARITDEAAITMTGDFAGTPHYLSPEQALAGRVQVDHRADIFSLGITLYELLTLAHPFDGATRDQVLSRIVTREPVDPLRLNKDLAPDLSAIVFKALEKDPDLRYPSAAAFAADLRAFLEYRPVTARRVSPITRTSRWVRREPLKAALAVTLILAIPATTGLLGYLLAKQPVLAAGESTLRQQKAEALLMEGFLVVFNREDRPAAERSFDALLATEPADPHALIGRVLCHFWDKTDGVAQSRLADAERLLPGEPAVARVRAGLLRILDRRDEADALLAKLPPPRSPLELFVAAYLGMLHAGDPAHEVPGATLSLAQEAVLRCPVARPHYYWLLAMTTVAAHDLAAARRVCGAMAILWPESDTIREVRAIALGRVDEQESVRIYETLLQKYPDRVEFLLDASHCWLRLGETDQALAACTKVEAMSLNDAVHLATLGSRFLKMGEVSRGRRALKRALELDPNQWTALLYQGVAQALSNQWGEARATLKRVLKQRPHDAETNRWMGIACVQENDMAAAEAPLRASVRADPNHAMAWFYLGACLLARAQVDAARDAFGKAAQAPVNATPAMVACAKQLSGTRTDAEMLEAIRAIVEEDAEAGFLSAGLQALEAQASRPAKEKR